MCIQCYESKLTRHGNMLVGASLGGKTTSWTILTKAMSRLNKDLEGGPRLTRDLTEKLMALFETNIDVCLAYMRQGATR